MINPKDRTARANYQKKVRRTYIELYPTDEDIKQHLDDLASRGEKMTSYIKRLIREDMAAQRQN